MLLNSHISADATCFAGKVCGLVWSTWGTSRGEDKLGARDKILNTSHHHWWYATQESHGATYVVLTLSLLIRPVWPSTYDELVSLSQKKIRYLIQR